jgi:hypothetical protein
MGRARLDSADPRLMLVWLYSDGEEFRLRKKIFI